MGPLPIGRPEVEAIHAEAIARFGGMGGLRDAGLLDSALAQPFQSFAGIDLYPGVAAKAAAYAWGIASNHPFADGNKRTAAAVMAAFLRVNDVPFRPDPGELYDEMVWIADGTWSRDDLGEWVEAVVRRS